MIARVSGWPKLARPSFGLLSLLLEQGTQDFGQHGKLSENLHVLKGECNEKSFRLCRFCSDCSHLIVSFRLSWQAEEAGFYYLGKQLNCCALSVPSLAGAIPATIQSEAASKWRGQVFPIKTRHGGKQAVAKTLLSCPGGSLARQGIIIEAASSGPRPIVSEAPLRAGLMALNGSRQQIHAGALLSQYGGEGIVPDVKQEEARLAKEYMEKLGRRVLDWLQENTLLM